jgi:hypothetical protein
MPEEESRMTRSPISRTKTIVIVLTVVALATLYGLHVTGVDLGLLGRVGLWLSVGLLLLELLEPLLWYFRIVRGGRPWE